MDKIKLHLQSSYPQRLTFDGSRGGRRSFAKNLKVHYQPLSPQRQEPPGPSQVGPSYAFGLVAEAAEEQLRN